MRRLQTLAIYTLVASVFLVSGWMVVSALDQVIIPISNSGTIKTVGVEVYANDALTQPLTQIDWESVSPGETKAFRAWALNTGNGAITLQMWTDNWSPPEVSQWIALTWNYDGSPISAGSAIPAAFTLSVAANVTGFTDFSCDIMIEGTPSTITNANLLVTDSTPEGPIPYLIDGNSGYQTGATYPLETGIHIIELPSTYTSPISGITYEFSHWDDSPSLTSSTRQINLSADTSLRSNYTET